MKLIILSAFGGRLKGEPMEWPNTPPYIFLPVMKAMEWKGYALGKQVPLTEDLVGIKKACFQATDKHEVLPNGRTAEIYELVEFPF